MLFQAVVFDLFGTLVPAFPSSLFEQSLGQMADAVGVSHMHFSRMWIEETWEARAMGGFASTEDTARYICNAVGVTPTKSQLAEAALIRVEFTRKILQPRPDAISTLKHVKSADLGLALISDCTPEVPQLWPETPFASLIDVPIFSCAVGMKKPDPRIYRLACDGLGVAPHKCLYVGDGFSRELTGAANVGMHTVLIASPGEVPADAPGYEGDTWPGPRVERLSEVMTLLRLGFDVSPS